MGGAFALLALAGCPKTAIPPPRNAPPNNAPPGNTPPVSVPAPRQAAGGPQLAVYFSPNGGCTDALVAEIAAARRSILVQAYSFTSAPIAEALVKAAGRGVKVSAVLDESNETAKYTGASFLVNASIPTLIDDKHAISHNKVMVIDDATVVTGSFNFTKNAEKNNAENAPDIVQKYRDNILAHAAHSHPYSRRATGSGTGERADAETVAETSPRSPRRKREKPLEIFGVRLN